MGHSIIACLLAAGHRVVAVSRNLGEHRDSKRRIAALLEEMRREGLLKKRAADLMPRLALSEDFADLAPCGIVIESIIEDVEVKRQTYRAVEEAVSPKTVIGSNTSSIPVTILQRDALHPERFVGVHWDEPAHVTRFMEIIAGERTSRACAKRVMALAEGWGKEPSLVRRDVRGFITNRISYAMFREACHLVDSGICTVEDVDRSLRNDVGWWIPFAGPFRYMDLMGPQSYYRVMQDLLPDLNTSPEIPKVMRNLVEKGGRGIANGRGFYRYTPEEAKRWARLFLQFNYDARKLALKYPAGVGSSRKKK
jgi:3-hydroxybutyryl-CoA dehydrogenase